MKYREAEFGISVGGIALEEYGMVVDENKGQWLAGSPVKREKYVPFVYNIILLKLTSP